MAWRLGRVLGPAKALALTRRLAALDDTHATPVNGGMSRRAFLERLGGAAMAFGVLATGKLVLPNMAGAAPSATTGAASGERGLDIQWLSAEETKLLAERAQGDHEVQQLQDWLETTSGSVLSTPLAFTAVVGGQPYTAVMFPDRAGSALLAYMVDLKPYAVVQLSNGQRGVFFIDHSQVTELPQENIPSPAALDTILPRHPQNLTHTNVVTAQDCCGECYACWALDAACIGLGVCCFTLFAPFCWVGLGECASAVTACAAATGCDCLSCF